MQRSLSIGTLALLISLDAGCGLLFQKQVSSLRCWDTGNQSTLELSTHEQRNIACPGSDSNFSEVMITVTDARGKVYQLAARRACTPNHQDMLKGLDAVQARGDAARERVWLVAEGHVFATVDRGTGQMSCWTETAPAWASPDGGEILPVKP